MAELTELVALVLLGVSAIVLFVYSFGAFGTIGRNASHARSLWKQLRRQTRHVHSGPLSSACPICEESERMIVSLFDELHDLHD